MRTRGNLDKNPELDDAAWEASRGAVVGAAKWGMFSLVAGLLAYQFSPIYRGLTVQFKVFLQMSGMAAGSMIEADSRLRRHEVQMRRYKRTARDAEVWRRYEEDFNVQQASSSSAAPEGGSDGASKDGN